MKKILKKPIVHAPVLRRLCYVMLAALMITGVFVIHTSAAEADDLLIGSVSAKYESNGNPATISTGCR